MTRSTIRLRAAKARRTNLRPKKSDGRQDWRRRPYWAGGVAGVSIMSDADGCFFAPVLSE
jgi:hypothetical protein